MQSRSNHRTGDNNAPFRRADRGGPLHSGVWSAGEPDSGGLRRYYDQGRASQKATPHGARGRLNLLAVTTPQRMSLFPDVPTLAESGLPGFEAGAWQGMLLPAGTPAEIVHKLNTAVNTALKDPGVLEKLAQQGTQALGSTPEAYGTYLQKELKRWQEVVAATGVSLN